MNSTSARKSRSLLGFSQAEWLGNPVLWYTQLHPDDRQRWHTEFAHTCATGERFRSIYRFHRARWADRVGAWGSQGGARQPMAGLCFCRGSPSTSPA